MSGELTRSKLNELVSEYGAAFYLLDSDVFEANYIKLSDAFKSYYKEFNIAYSCKTNYIPKLVKIVDRLGGYAEVVSDMEMQIALKSGVEYKRIIWNGPIKNSSKVEELLLNGGTVNIDSIYELEGIKKIAEKHNDKQINIGIRCNYDVGDGVLSRFGIDVESEDFNAAIKLSSQVSNIHINGLHVHYAKRLPKYWDRRTEGILNLYDRIKDLYGITLERIDIGGGMYGNMPDILRRQLGIGCITYEDYASKAAKMFSEYFQNKSEKPELLIEPGSALAGDCMRFVCRVETIKEVRGKSIATVYGSQKNINMAGVNPPIEIVSCGKEQTQYESLDIVGYTCIEGDVIYKNFSGKLSVGDYVVINNCGSYSIVMKPPFILPDFPVLDISGNNVEVIKRTETFDDVFDTYVF